MNLEKTSIEPTADVLNDETAGRTFECLSLPPPILSALQNVGFVRPSPVQLNAIPLGRLGVDLIVQAKSGTGKTCVFCVVALENVLVYTSNKTNELEACPTPLAVVLTPTREIAVQVNEVMAALGSEIPQILIHPFIGGLPVREDIDVLTGKGKYSEYGKRGCHVSVGTPGRMLHLIEEKIMNVSKVKLFVLDEADKLMTANFWREIMTISKLLPVRKQVMALSATYPRNVLRRVKSLMFNPKFVQVGVDQNVIGNNINSCAEPLNKSENFCRKGSLDLPSLVGVTQYYFEIEERGKNVQSNHASQNMNVFSKKVEKLCDILSEMNFLQCVVFCNQRTHAESIAETLGQEGWPSISLSSQQSQENRLKNIKNFKDYHFRVLVTTDISARGIDISNVSLVINMEVPYDPETYTHRIGRTGRFGSRGTSIMLIESSERPAVAALEDMYSMEIFPLPDSLVSSLSHQKGIQLPPPVRQPKTKSVHEAPKKSNSGKVSSFMSSSKDSLLAMDANAVAGKVEQWTASEHLNAENEIYDTWVSKYKKHFYEYK